MTDWRFDFHPQPTMPPLAWVAVVQPGLAAVHHGASVRTAGAAFFEGTWAGPSDLSALPEATTVFGTGMVTRGDQLIAIPPSHHLECLYVARASDVHVGDALVVSNSLPGLLAATGLELDPHADYSKVFLGAVKAVWLIDEPRDGELRLRHQRFEIPTKTNPITGWYVENLVIRPNLSIGTRRRPREAPFASFADYKSRLTAATASLIANGRPYEPVVSLSGGYDSAAVAAVAGAAGTTRAVGFETARPVRHADDADSGARTAAALGLEFVARDRLAYLARSDLTEADLLASGMAGEDLIFLGLEPEIRRSIFLHGYWAGTEFAFHDRHAWQHVSPITTSGADFTEFRLRSDFFNVPLPVFGAIRTSDAPNLLDRAEMDPYRVGGKYDRPIPRRLAEEAGVRRGTFAVTKRAANVLPPREGMAAFTPAARESIARFAATQGGHAECRTRRPFSRYERGLLRAAQRLHLSPLAHALGRRQASLAHFEPRLGNLLFRWAVSVVAERYEQIERAY